MRSILDIRRLLNAARHSLAGLLEGVRHHTSFRQELIGAAVLAPLAFWLGEDGVERAVLLSALMLMVIVEIVNSAIELLVDRIGTERNELSRRAKDLGSAAVFLSMVNVLLVWGVVLLS